MCRSRIDARDDGPRKASANVRLHYLVARPIASKAAGQPVKARHHQYVAFGKLADDAAQLGAVGLRAARRFAVDFGATFGANCWG
jgi:hypothetical protein